MALFPTPRLPHEDGVVLLATAEDLAHALDFLGTSDDRVKSTFFGHAGQITPKVVKHRRLRFGIAFACCRASGTGCAAIIFSRIAWSVTVRERMVSTRRGASSVF